MTAPSIPAGQSSRIVADALRTDFDGAGPSPVTVAIRAPSSDRGAVASFARRVGDLPGVTRVSRPQLLGAATWEVDAAVSGDPAGKPGTADRRRGPRDPGDVHGQGDR